YERLVFDVAKTLLNERGYSQRHIAGEDMSVVRDIINQLIVTRPPPDDLQSTDKHNNTAHGENNTEEQLYADVDEILRLEQSRRPLVDASTLPSVIGDDSRAAAQATKWSQIVLWKGDITTLRATAIVNAANSALLGCFQPTHKCIDNVIHCKAGPRLRAACHEIMSRGVDEEPVGDAKITPGFALPAEYVIHTVGPQLKRGKAPTAVQRHQLQSCYTSSLELLLATIGRDTPATIAFPCISTGLFAFPSDVAVPLAVEGVLEWLEAHPEASSWKVIFNTFMQTDHELYKQHIERRLGGAMMLPLPAADPALETAMALVRDADYLLITAGAGLSAAAGLDYTSEEVMKKHHPSAHRKGMRTMYHFVGREDLPAEFVWGYFFEHISVARFDWAKHRTAPTYAMLKSIRDRYESRTPGSTFVATTNADGMFGQEGFPLESIYTVQGDFALIQCRAPCSRESVFDIAPFIERGLAAMDPETCIVEPRGIPVCPTCGGEMSLCLRMGDWFLESWFLPQKKAYRKWLSEAIEVVRAEKKKLVVLEIGVGFNTPGILRHPDEHLAEIEGVSLVRINAEHPEIPFQSHGVGLSVDANEALSFISERIATQQ
ncbi:hypothetical protein PybrP1_010931, partial [[Pythium] brassicae (nom. inval.)]